MNLKEGDKVYSNHRCHAHYLAKGGDLKSMICEIYGKENGCLGGRGGSMHLSDLSVNFMTSIPIIGSSVPLAVGNALSEKLKKKNNVSVCFFGDAAIEEGVLHECMNFASLKNLKVLFVCENNRFSIYTHLNQRQPMNRSIEKIALAHNISYKTVDSFDVKKVIDATSKSMEHIQNNSSPYFLVLNTYRWKEHCGPSNDDHLNYRDKVETERWVKKRCSIKALDTFLKKHDDNWLKTKKKYDNIIREEIEQAFMDAINSKLPKKKDSWKFIYA